MGDSALHLGELERFVLLAILRLGRQAYGIKIREVIEERTARRLSIGTIYTTLDRLKEKGYISSYLADRTPVRGGRAKQFYEIEGAGEAALNESQTALQRMLDGLAPLPGRL